MRPPIATKQAPAVRSIHQRASAATPAAGREHGSLRPGA
jgi:hypothetical protein